MLIYIVNFRDFFLMYGRSLSNDDVSCDMPKEENDVGQQMMMEKVITLP